ncbi:MAG TPA: Maf family nucleotide pyrophosphatase [Solirubrobacteraceae bacterium]|nr:Maf family nucleotide pyrophosphatase [Solirubrobacteraceae bacterium]
MLTLASSSPQRQALLARMGIAHRVVAPEVSELSAGDPEAVARHNALAKARAVAAQRQESVILGADTVVALEGRIYDKPTSEAQARETLVALAGREHQVVGAIALICPDGQERCAITTTRVRMRAYDERLLEWYLARGEWRGRAGGYAIQGAGAALVRELEGDYENVVGLSIAALLDLCPALLSRA